jgi:adenylate kinase
MKKLSNKKPKIIIVMGPPGSGKGTQAELLAEKFGFFQWETSGIVGRIIEQAKKGDFVVIDGKKYYFEEQGKIRKKGMLWDSNFILYFTKKKIKELAEEGKGIIMSGSPRTLDEGEKLTPFLKKLYGAKNIIVIALKLTPKATIWRNSHRRECELATHSILYTKETKKLTKCPLDGSKLIHRKDDNPKIIKTRLKEYEEKTFPLIQLFKKQGLKIKEINGEQPVADVFKDILKVLR